MILKKINKKICILITMVLSLFAVVNINAAALESNFDDNYEWFSEDNTYKKGYVDYWIVRESWLFGSIDRTKSYIYLYDEDGEPLDNIVRIAAQYKCGNEKYEVFATANNSNGDFFNFINSTNKTGTLEKRDKSAHYVKDDELKLQFADATPPYEKHAQLVWTWNWVVDQIVYMYVWYEDDSGNEIVGSFFENGEHPIYDSSGNLLGIYDVEGNLLEDLTLNGSMIQEVDPTSGEQTDLLTYDMQLAGEVSVSGLSSIDNKIGGLFNNLSDNVKTALRPVIIVLGLAIGLIVIFYILKFCKWVYSGLKR